MTGTFDSFFVTHSFIMGMRLYLSMLLYISFNGPLYRFLPPKNHAHAAPKTVAPHTNTVQFMFSLLTFA
jgi:hypothetical protein